MKINEKDKEEIPRSSGADSATRLWGESWTYIKTVVDVAQEPALILDKDLRVVTANRSFYRIFQVEPKDTERKIIYELGNGQWNIPSLRALFEDILLKSTFFKGFEIVHEFPIIGRKTMILNARQVHSERDTVGSVFSPVVLLVMEDVTDILAVAETLANHANQLETKHREQTQKLEIYIRRLERENSELKERA